MPPWVFFFTGLLLTSYPQVIEAAVNEIGAGLNSVGVNFPGDLDEWDIATCGALPADCVEIYEHGFGQTLMPRATFYAILQAFAERLTKSTGQAANWYEAMHTALARLQAKIAADAAAA